MRSASADVLFGHNFFLTRHKNAKELTGMYKKAKLNWTKHLDFAIVDLIFLAVAYYLSVLLRFGLPHEEFRAGMYLQLCITILLIYFLIAMFGNAYKNIIRRTRYQELRAVLVQVILTFLLFTAYIYFSRQAFLFSRQVLIQIGIFSAFLIYCARIAWKRIIRLHMLNNVNLPHMLVISDKITAARAIKTMKKRRYNMFYISGCAIVDQDLKGETVEGVPVVCNSNEIRKYVVSEVVDEVFLAINDQRSQRSLVNYLLEAGVTIHISLMDNATSLPNCMTEKIGGHIVMTTTNNAAEGWQLLFKRLLDIVGAVVGLIITGILFLFIAPQIKKADPGPVFFSQMRVGKNGRQFKIYKFRSMYMDAEERKKDLLKDNEMNGFIFKMENDPRVLPGIGERIRTRSLDEFPQFFNVLKGDMSLVGTRPPTLEEFKQYDAHHKMRLSFKPGLTGLWQVSGRSTITDFEKIVALDNEYIKTWNLRLDIRILFKTIGVVISKQGAS